MEDEASITGLLSSWAAQPSNGDAAVFALVYDRLHEIAAAHCAKLGDRRILQTTAVLNEAYLRLAKAPGRKWNDREHFFASCSRVMRHVLLDFARDSRRSKRGASALHITLDDRLVVGKDPRCVDVIAVHEALSALETLDPERARVVELRFFGGMEHQEIAAALDVSESTVRRRWRLARAWIFDYLRQAG
ncbi:MAG: ECF-type sigma factor [Holophagales bacterium]|nr:ECF-type sigma factor [Holophagales bacterium]